MLAAAMGRSSSGTPPPRTAQPAIRSQPGFGILALLAVFLVLSSTWALRVPRPVDRNLAEWGNFNPDEANHLQVIAYMAEHARFPPYERTYATSHHPPLYHALAAVVYAAAAPVAGADGVVLLLRLLSCVMGAATIVLIHRAALELLDPAGALLAAGCAGGVPMFVSLSGAVNNENLSSLTAAGALATLVMGIRRGFDTKRAAAAAFWVAANVATKFTGLGLLPTAVAAIWWSGRRRGASARRTAAQSACVVGASTLLMGWWFARNALVFGDPFRQAAHYKMMHGVQPGFAELSVQHGTSAAGYLLLVTKVAWISFWGIFDGMLRLMPTPIYVVFAVVQIAAACGLILLWRREGNGVDMGPVVGMMGLFAVFVAAVFYRFNWVHFTPQGRYFFPLLLPFGIATAAGWRTIFPPHRRNAASAALLAALLIVNLYLVALMPTRA